jgi:sirohydrochlorin cobaltochelatase
MLRANGHANYHVATIEGYPTQETALAQIKVMKGKKVTLVPLLFVAGDHANNDISVEWKEALEKEGLAVDVKLEGLGEVPEIQNLFIKKVVNSEK